MSIQFTPHMWPSGSSKLRPYMKLYSSFGLGSATPPAAAALLTISSTSVRLSADRQNSAWFEVFASEIGFGVNCRNFSWVRQHRVDGLGKDHAARCFVAELRVPGRTDRLVKGSGALEVGHGQIEENHPGHRSSLGGVLPKDGRPSGDPTRLPDLFLPPAREVLSHRTRGFQATLTSSRSDRGEWDRPTARSRASRPARCRG